MLGRCEKHGRSHTLSAGDDDDDADDDHTDDVGDYEDDDHDNDNDEVIMIIHCFTSVQSIIGTSASYSRSLRLRFLLDLLKFISRRKYRIL